MAEVAARARRELQALCRALAGRLEPPSVVARPPATPLALFALLEESLAQFAALEARGLAAHRDRFVTPAWTVKDLVGHLGTWASEFRREVETVARGESFDYSIPFALSVLGPTAWNEKRAGEQRRFDYATLAGQFRIETTRIQDLALTLPPALLYSPARFPLSPSGDPEALIQVIPAAIILGKDQHDRHHLARLGALLDRIETRRKP